MSAQQTEPLENPYRLLERDLDLFPGVAAKDEADYPTRLTSRIFAEALWEPGSQINELVVYCDGDVPHLAAQLKSFSLSWLYYYDAMVLLLSVRCWMSNRGGPSDLLMPLDEWHTSEGWLEHHVDWEWVSGQIVKEHNTHQHRAEARRWEFPGREIHLTDNTTSGAGHIVDELRESVE